MGQSTLTPDSVFGHWRSVFKFYRLDRSFREIVFYGEDMASWVHLEPLARELVETHNRKVSYLTSSSADPGLQIGSDLYQGFCIGAGAARTALFKGLEARILVTTTPDLGTKLFQRSRRTAHYVYVHHSMVSTHMIYRRDAFDQFDTIFCVGPHHVEETRAAEAFYGLCSKSLIAHGYGRLDQISEARNSSTNSMDESERPSESNLHVLLAPTWGPSGLIESVGPELVRILIEAGFLVTVRPHPETLKRSPEAVEATANAGQGSPLFQLERDVSTLNSLLSADVMISDWSGVALEYAFGLERPVLFVDVPRKILNPEYELIGLLPLEVSIRDKIGVVVSVEQIDRIPGMLREMTGSRQRWRTATVRVREEFVFNPGESASVGANCLLQIASGSAVSGANVTARI